MIERSEATCNPRNTSMNCKKLQTPRVAVLGGTDLCRDRREPEHVAGGHLDEFTQRCCLADAAAQCFQNAQQPVLQHCQALRCCQLEPVPR